MKMSAALEGFSLFAAAGAYSPETAAPYLCALQKLSAFLADPDVESITEADLLGFFAFLRSDYAAPRAESGKLSEASMHRYWKATRAFFKWAGVRLQVPRPDLALAIPRYDSKEIVPFSREEVKRMLAACASSKTVRRGSARAYHLPRPTAQRDQAIIRLLLDTGIRVGELCRLRVVDANIESSTIAVLPHRKGKTKARVIPMGDAARQEIWTYIARRRETGTIRGGDALFVVDGGAGIGRHRIEALITYLAGRAGVADAHPHRFRHTFAIEYLRGGGDVFTLQYILGHSSMEMVRRYLQIAQMDVEAAHRRASPGDRWHL